MSFEDRYFEFERQFRGSEDLITNRLEVYVESFNAAGFSFGDKNALDLGCGRGEWLSLLTSKGANPIGVDSNKDMVKRAVEKGLKVSAGDAIEFLKTSETTYDLISAFHLIEHLETSDWETLIDLAFEKLNDGGFLILETPNPENLSVSSFGFYMDPTHIRPIPPDLLTFQIEQAGFTQHKLLRLNGISREPSNLSEAMFAIGPDIGIIAEKASSTNSLDFSLIPAAGISTAEAISLAESNSQLELKHLVEEGYLQVQNKISQIQDGLADLFSRDEAENRFKELSLLFIQLRDQLDEGRYKKDKEIQVLTAQLSSLRDDLNQMSSKMLEVIRDNQESKAELEISNREIDSLKKSWSWRITRPLRTVGSWLSSGRGD